MGEGRVYVAVTISDDSPAVQAIALMVVVLGTFTGAE